MRTMSAFASGLATASFLACALLSAQPVWAKVKQPEIDNVSATREKVAKIQALPANARPRVKVSVRQEGKAFYSSHGNTAGDPDSSVTTLHGAVGPDVATSGTDQIRHALERALLNSKHFRVVSNTLQDFGEEEQLDTGGYSREDTAVKRGKMLNAQYAVLVTILEINSGEEETHGGISFMGLHVGGKRGDAMVRLGVQLVDLETREVVFEGEAEGRQKRGGGDVGANILGIEASLGKTKSPTLGAAIQNAIAEVVVQLAENVEVKG